MIVTNQGYIDSDLCEKLAGQSSDQHRKNLHFGTVYCPTFNKILEISGFSLDIQCQQYAIRAQQTFISRELSSIELEVHYTTVLGTTRIYSY